MNYWNQIAWAVFWGLLCVISAVPTIGIAFEPRSNLVGTIFGWV